MSSLRERLIKNSTIDLTSTLTDSKIYSKKDMIPTLVPMINVALSGTLDGGLTPGLTLICGPSKNFKSGFALLMISSFLNKYPDGVVLFYDSEFGSPQGYFKKFGIPMDQVIHSPITDIEELKFDIMKQINDIARTDKVIIVIDSIGNLASKKEVDDALDQKSVADYTRAKQLKSLFRMVTPHLTVKDIPLIAINHTYKTLELYSKDVVSGGTGIYLSADNIWILGRQQDKDDKTKTIDGYHFIINVEKSRYVKEKSKIPISISYENGIDRWSGLLDVALDGEYIVKPKKGYYAVVDKKTGEVSEDHHKEEYFINNKEFWTELIKNTDFAKYIKDKFSLDSEGSILYNDE